jgi:hypothetical protein
MLRRNLLHAKRYPVSTTGTLVVAILLLLAFCERRRSDGARRFVAGPAGVYICEWCIELCAQIIQEELRPTRLQI